MCTSERRPFFNGSLFSPKASLGGFLISPVRRLRQEDLGEVPRLLLHRQVRAKRGARQRIGERLGMRGRRSQGAHHLSPQRHPSGHVTERAKDKTHNSWMCGMHVLHATMYFECTTITGMRVLHALCTTHVLLFICACSMCLNLINFVVGPSSQQHWAWLETPGILPRVVLVPLTRQCFLFSHEYQTPLAPLGPAWSAPTWSAPAWSRQT